MSTGSLSPYPRALFLRLRTQAIISFSTTSSSPIRSWLGSHPSLFGRHPPAVSLGKHQWSFLAESILMVDAASRRRPDVGRPGGRKRWNEPDVVFAGDGVCDWPGFFPSLNSHRWSSILCAPAVGRVSTNERRLRGPWRFDPPIPISTHVDKFYPSTGHIMDLRSCGDEARLRSRPDCPRRSQRSSLRMEPLSSVGGSPTILPVLWHPPVAIRFSRERVQDDAGPLPSSSLDLPAPAQSHYANAALLPSSSVMEYRS
ncbi:hypothetical protein C8F01DRAFT_691212 [Mycena amicta]|nr:hypothetical protein C8F01DRAFT_691212 [Mycena amicta]